MIDPSIPHESKLTPHTDLTALSADDVSGQLLATGQGQPHYCFWSFGLILTLGSASSSVFLAGALIASLAGQPFLSLEETGVAAATALFFCIADRGVNARQTCCSAAETPEVGV